VCLTTDVGIVKIAEGCHDLRELGAICNITDLSIFNLSDGCPKLYILDIRGCWDVTGKSLRKLLRKGCEVEYYYEDSYDDLEDDDMLKIYGPYDDDSEDDNSNENV
jgi:hypothetical protein